MDSLTYWKIREEKAKQNYIAEEEEYNKELAKIYNALLVTIETLINSFFQKYAKAEGITMAEALQKVAQMDVQAFQTKAKQYVQSRNFSKQANAELRLYNATMKINRLELLKANIGLEMIDSFNQMQGQFDANLLKRAADEFSRQAGILGMGVDKAPKMARAIVNASFHNADFSTRIWANQGQLRNELSILLSNGIVQGIHSRELAKQIEKKFGVSKSNAERLMRTEMARVQIAAQEESYRANGYEQYVFLAIGTACPGCLALNEQHFNVSEMQSGENAPPMHPNCRCSTAAWMDRAETMKQIKAMSQVKSTEEYSDKKKMESFYSKRDITKSWTDGKDKTGSVKLADSVSVNGVTYKVDGRKVVSEPDTHEIEVANILSRKYNKQVELLPKVKTPQNIQTADYLIDGEKYDLKTPEGNGKNTLSGLLKHKSGQARNFIFDTSITEMSKEEVERQITRIYGSPHRGFVDKIVVISNGNVEKVYERSK